ncbi:Protein CBG01405 [Caenorhabditis briggsae]|uniref:Protein CBG01405 n=1 Tax=Caenorhabditis briggsae TaxID=6238 RepID=A8WQC3_CAEBR|nr:Protein CBG01405 [Caenorhabditis briggsae]CAP22681.2 Protein CBG01405 [Caenorhabditis briggsae]
MIALFSVLLALLAPQALNAAISGELNCTTYNGTSSHASTVPPSPNLNACLPNGEPSSLPTAHLPADSVTRVDVWMVSRIVPTIAPSAKVLECKILSINTARRRAKDVRLLPPLDLQPELEPAPAPLTLLTPALPALPGLLTDSAPTPSTQPLNADPIVLLLADSARAITSTVI